MTDFRLQAAADWAESLLGQACEVVPLAGDASFRRYFRVHTADCRYVLMDAPPDKERLEPFLFVRAWMAQSDVRVPKLLGEDKGQGFLLLEDFGDMTWSLALQRQQPIAPMLEDAWRQLLLIQASHEIASLPRFDVDRMRLECDLFLDWYLPYVADCQPSEDERGHFHEGLLPLLTRIDAMPKVAVHLDYHSRNLMLPSDSFPLGVIDFQDAVYGPVTYDAASLLYDCYQDYPESLRQEWSLNLWERLPQEMRAGFQHEEHWHESLRLTALQRHIKAMGIFARLAYRDGKQQFLNEIPLTRKHLLEEIAALDLDLPELLLR